METATGYDGGSAGAPMASGGNNRADGPERASSFPPQGDEQADADVIRPITLRENQGLEGRPYPERPAELDCAYYIRTGRCRFGKTCKFNHPSKRKLAAAKAINNGEYPERLGETECQYYLMTGTCKFGATCKFHHPKEKAGIVGKVQLNILGFPLRPNELECSYYLRTGHCNFGNTCRFHHPQLSNNVLSYRGSPIYPAVHSTTTHSPQPVEGLMNVQRTSFIPSPRWRGPSSHTQVIPPGMMPIPGWNSYTESPGYISSTQCQQQPTGSGQFYYNSRQNGTTADSTQGPFSLRASAIPMDLYSMHKESTFPDRPGESECVFYMKTGDCKFGATCRFHHPREQSFSVPDSLLSPLGLPLRPEEPPCISYSRYGICKLGPNCKFNHPMDPLTNAPPTSSTENPVGHHVLASASETASPTNSGEENSGNPIELPKSEPHLIASAENGDDEGLCLESF